MMLGDLRNVGKRRREHGGTREGYDERRLRNAENANRRIRQKVTRQKRAAVLELGEISEALESLPKSKKMSALAEKNALIVRKNRLEGEKLRLQSIDLGLKLGTGPKSGARNTAVERSRQISQAKRGKRLLVEAVHVQGATRDKPAKKVSRAKAEALGMRGGVKRSKNPLPKGDGRDGGESITINWRVEVVIPLVDEAEPAPVLETPEDAEVRGAAMRLMGLGLGDLAIAAIRRRDQDRITHALQRIFLLESIDEGYESGDERAEPREAWLDDPDVDPEAVAEEISRQRDGNPLPDGDGRDGGKSGREKSGSDSSSTHSSESSKNRAQRKRAEERKRNGGKSDVGQILKGQIAEAQVKADAAQDVRNQLEMELKQKADEEKRARVILRNAEIDHWRKEIAAKGLSWYSKVDNYLTVEELPVDDWAGLWRGLYILLLGIFAFVMICNVVIFRFDHAWWAGFAFFLAVKFMSRVLGVGVPMVYKHHVTFTDFEEDDVLIDRRRDAFAHVDLKYPANYMRMKWVVLAYDRHGRKTTITVAGRKEESLLLYDGSERVSFSLMHLAYYVNHKPDTDALDRVATEMKRIAVVNIDSSAMENAVGVASMAVAAVWMASVYSLRDLHRGVNFAGGVVPGLARPRFF